MPPFGVQEFRSANFTGLNLTLTQPAHIASTQASTQGWTPSPNGRGSIDIIWSCVVTMFLCSWSALCLQLPSRTDSQFDILWRRSWLTALCALGPEFTFQLALGQWCSARQSVRDFHASGITSWTMKHAFHADSGGFFLRTPDFREIPIDAKQLLYLINHQYIKDPELTENDIDGKNRVDVLLRLISIGQILWFCVTLIARGAQGLFITGMELTTAAFILCSFGTTFCWWNKGADIAVPETLTSETTMAQILIEGGDAAGKPYHRTPLDFISREEWHWSLYWTHWINILRRIHIIFAPTSLPHDRIENTVWHDLKARGAFPAFMMLSLLYSAIFLSLWNDHFPTKTEQLLWRIASLSMLGSIVLYFMITGYAWVWYPALQKYFQTRAYFRKSESETKTALEEQVEIAVERSAQGLKARSRLSDIAARLRNNSILKDPSLDVPLKATLPIYVVGFFYCCSRTAIWILDIIQFRSLPSSAYTTVNWGGFFAHLG
ncbi:hypothetical protein B7463_g11462, partial [Scytalidium lignicola]